MNNALGRRRIEFDLCLTDQVTRIGFPILDRAAAFLTTVRVLALTRRLRARRRAFLRISFWAEAVFANLISSDVTIPIATNDFT